MILVEETELNEDYGTDVERKYHMRAKILSNEARDLADIEIPLGDREKITDWWGRTLLPDGTVLDVEERELTEQDVVRAGRWEVRALKVALPGVVPGCVIDFGYTVKSETRYRSRRVKLQQKWPVLRMRYRWKPTSAYPSAYRVYRSQGLDIAVERDRNAVLIEGRNLPPVAEEPMMPPDHEVRAAAILYYLSHNVSYKYFWDDKAKEFAKNTRRSASGGLVQRALSALEGHRDADLLTQLKQAYDWIGANVDNPLFLGRTAAPQDVSAGAEDPLDQLFIEIARELGAAAHVVLAPDRRRHVWDRELKTLRQFEARLVAAYPPDEPDVEVIIVDPSSGLEFAEIPWWVSGVEGLMATREGAQSVFLPPSSPAKNIAQTNAKLRFSDDGTALIAESTRVARGAVGVELAQLQAGLTTAARQDRLDRMCGFGPDVEIRVAEAVVGYPGVTTKLTCDTERFLPEPVQSFGRYLLSWGGPWVGPPPQLPPGPREHPVVFDFPRVEILELEFNLPDGFRLEELPADTNLVTPYGKYALAFSSTPEAAKVERAFALLPLAVPPDEYDALRAFLEDVRQGDATRLTIERLGDRP